MTRKLLSKFIRPQSKREPLRGRLMLERLEARQMLAADVDLFATDGQEDLSAIDNTQTNAFANASESNAQGEAAPDLVAFAKALSDAGVVFFGAHWCPACTQQKELFQDGTNELPFVEVTNPDRSLNQVGTDNNITTFPTWVFPDDTRETGVLSLDEISSRSGVTIPTSETPTFSPIGARTVAIGSPLHLAVDAYDPNGDPLTVTVSVNDPDLLEAVVLQGNRSLRMDMVGYGDMVFELFEQRAPRPSGRVIELANDGFYDGIIFHRVIDNFVLQGGDPTGTGAGGSNLGDFDDQFHPDLQHTSTGVLSYAKNEPDDTNDSQFFITEGNTQHLDFNHSVFGMLVEGEDVREAISETEVTKLNDEFRPTNNVTIESFSVFNDNENSVIMLRPTGDGVGNTSITVTVRDGDGNEHSEVVPVTIVADNSNAQPFLEDIGPVTSPQGTPATFTLSAIDLEEDPVTYFASVDDGSGATASVNQNTGVVTVDPPNSTFSGPVSVFVGVRAAVPTSDALDSQLVTATFLAGAPTAIDLVAASDSGSSSSDNVTRSAPLTFNVSGVQVGATVELLSGDTVIGGAAANGTTVSITTNNITALGDGTYSITARQRGSDGINSPLSPPLALVFDSTLPEEITGSFPSQANVGTLFSFNLAHPEEGLGLVYQLSNPPTGVTINAETGLIEWTPTENQTGDNTINVRLTDAAGNTRTQAFGVTVEEEATASILLGITDLDGNVLSSLNVGTEFLLTFDARDGRGLSAAGIFAAFTDIRFDSSLVETVGDTPIQFNSAFGGGQRGTVSAGLIDDVGAFASSTTPSNQADAEIATIRMRAIAPGQVTFTSDPPEASGTELLVYENNDRVPVSEVGFGSVSLTIEAGFTVQNDSFTVAEDSQNNSFNVLANDDVIGGNGNLSIDSVSDPENGSASIVNGRIIYSPTADFSGSDVFTYVASDNVGAQQTATVTVSVTAVNDQPQAIQDRFEVVVGSSNNSLDVLANDTDLPDSGETLTVASVGTTTAGGTVSIASGGTAILYTPPAGFTGTDTLTYTISDGALTSLPATINIDVGLSNPPPIAAPDAFTIDEDFFDPANDPDSEAEFDVMANDSTNDPTETLSIASVGTSENGGTVRLSDDGTKLFYRPPANFFGTDRTTYTLLDSGGATAIGEVTFTVSPVNDAPPAGPITATVVTGTTNTTVVTLDQIGTNVDGDEALTITTVGTPTAGGTVQIATNGTTVTYSPPTDTFVGQDTFTYTVTDPSGLTTQGTVTLSVVEYEPRDFVVNLNFATSLGNIALPSARLRGTTNFGDPVDMTQPVSGDTGQIVFASQAPGTYEIEIPAMPFLVGGQEAQIIPLTSALADGDANGLLAEIGTILPQYISIRDFLLTTPPESVFAVVSPGQGSTWLLPSTELGTDLTSPSVSLNNDSTQLSVEVTNTGGSVQQASVPLSDRDNVEVRGQVNDFRLVRINIASSALNYSDPGVSPASTSGEGESTAQVPLIGGGTAEGEFNPSVQSTTESELAATAQQRLSAIDSAFADVAEPGNAPTTAEDLLTGPTVEQTTDPESVDEVVRVLADQ